MRVLIAFSLTILATPVFATAPTFQTVAPVAYMWDTSSGAELYAKDADKRMPPASMAKMMTVYVIFDMIEKGQLRLDQKYTVRPETWAKWHGTQGGSTMFLSSGEQVSVENLLKGIVTLSGNDACVTLAENVGGTEEAFTNRMNAAAHDLGLTNSHFETSNGWPDGGRTYTTAHDLAHLAAATITKFPELYKQFYGLPNFSWGKTMGGNNITQANRNPLLGKVTGADGLKTGHTDESGYGFTGSAEQNGRRIVMVVSGLDTYNHRAEESVKLIQWGFGAWAAHTIYAKGAHIGEATVQMGSSRSVGLIAEQTVTATLPAGIAKSMRVSIAYDSPIKAPIAAGQHIADLVMATGDTPPQRAPLFAESAVSEAGFFMRIWLGLLSLFGM